MDALRAQKRLLEASNARLRAENASLKENKAESPTPTPSVAPVNKQVPAQGSSAEKVDAPVASPTTEGKQDEPAVVPPAPAPAAATTTTNESIGGQTEVASKPKPTRASELLRESLLVEPSKDGDNNVKPSWIATEHKDARIERSRVVEPRGISIQDIVQEVAEHKPVSNGTVVPAKASTTAPGGPQDPAVRGTGGTHLTEFNKLAGIELVLNG